MNILKKGKGVIISMLRTLVYQLCSLMFIFACYTTYGAWNDHVSPGQTITSAGWNALVDKVASIQGGDGMLCGTSSDDHGAGHINIILCKGHDPRDSCPTGYSKRTIFQADDNYMYSCVSNSY